MLTLSSKVITSKITSMITSKAEKSFFCCCCCYYNIFVVVVIVFVSTFVLPFSEMLETQ